MRFISGVLPTESISGVLSVILGNIEGVRGVFKLTGEEGL